MSRLAARVLTGTALALLAAALLWLDGRSAPGHVPLIVVTILALLCAWELDRMGVFRGRGFSLPLTAAVSGLAVFELRYLDERSTLSVSGELGLLYLLALAASAVGSLAAALFRRERPGADLLAVPLSLWLLPPFFALITLEREFGCTGLAVLVVLAKIGDNAGFFVGRALGKRHPFPRVSPGKTVAGCVASLLAGITAGALLLPYTLGTPDPRGFLVGALLGGLINIAAQAGDLSESWIKRRAGVKDASGLVGPAGGVLDVVDSLLLASPVALLSWAWLYGALPRQLS